MIWKTFKYDNLIDQYLIVAAFGTVGHQAWIDVLKAQINVGRSTGNDFAFHVEKGMR